jgi:hypothetical protein
MSYLQQSQAKTMVKAIEKHAQALTQLDANKRIVSRVYVQAVKASNSYETDSYQLEFLSKKLCSICTSGKLYNCDLVYGSQSCTLVQSVTPSQ